MLHVGEVFEVLENNQEAKKDPRVTGGMQVVRATGQEWGILEFRRLSQEMWRLRELKITNISDIQSQLVGYVKLFILEISSVMLENYYMVHLLDQLLRIWKQKNASS